LLVLALTLLGTAAQAQGFARMEMIPVPTVTLTSQQILTGDLNGKPATIAGELRIPKRASTSSPPSSWCTAQAA